MQVFQGDVSYTVNFFELEPKSVNKVEAGSRLGDTKNIIIKSSNLTLNSVGKDAFKGVNNKVVITVPKKQYKVYKKLIRERGVVTSAKIKVQTF